MPEVEAVNWFALLEPRGTLGTTVVEIRKAFVAAVTDPSVVKKLVEAGIVPMVQTSRAEFYVFFAEGVAAMGQGCKRCQSFIIKLAEIVPT